MQISAVKNVANHCSIPKTWNDFLKWQVRNCQPGSPYSGFLKNLRKINRIILPIVCTATVRNNESL